MYTVTHIHKYTNTYIHACMHACMHTYIHPYIHTSIHPYIHTSIHPCIRTFIHKYIYICLFYISTRLFYDSRFTYKQLPAFHMRLYGTTPGALLTVDGGSASPKACLDNAWRRPTLGCGSQKEDTRDCFNMFFQI